MGLKIKVTTSSGIVLLMQESIVIYSLVPIIESYPKANQGVFDNFSCQ